MEKLSLKYRFGLLFEFKNQGNKLFKWPYIKFTAL
jgi:hypothetical protein